MLNTVKFSVVEKVAKKYYEEVQMNDAMHEAAVKKFEEDLDREFQKGINEGLDKLDAKIKAIRIVGSRPQKQTIEVPTVQLDPQVKQEVVCMILDSYLGITIDPDDDYDEEKFFTPSEIKALIEHCIKTKVLTTEKQQFLQFYTAALPEYDIAEIVSSINKKLALVDRCIEVNKEVSPHQFRGYDGLLDDFFKAGILSKKTPINEKPFQLTKGTITYEVMTILRNTMANRTSDLENEYDDKKSRKKLKENISKEQYVMKNLPAGPILCIENSIYNNVDNDAQILRDIRWRIVELAQAIINHKVLQVKYFSVGMGEDIEFVFHPHYIKQVGKRFICYGMSRMLDKKAEKEYKLVNIIIPDIKNIQEYQRVEDYQSAESLGLDYNHTVFKDRMTYNAPKFNKEKDEPEEVVIKVRREIRTDTGYVKPFERILREPLHHSQTVAEDYGIDPEWGYIRLQLIDLMYITPILLTEGSKMEVLVPERLRNLMAQKVKELALLYYPELDFETGQEAHKEQNTI